MPSALSFGWGRGHDDGTVDVLAGRDPWGQGGASKEIAPRFRATRRVWLQPRQGAPFLRRILLSIMPLFMVLLVGLPRVVDERRPLDTLASNFRLVIPARLRSSPGRSSQAHQSVHEGAVRDSCRHCHDSMLWGPIGEAEPVGGDELRHRRGGQRPPLSTHAGGAANNPGARRGLASRRSAPVCRSSVIP